MVHDVGLTPRTVVVAVLQAHQLVMVEGVDHAVLRPALLQTVRLASFSSRCQ